MKKIKYIIGLLAWLVLGATVDAATGNYGICYGKELVPGDTANMGYCYLYPDKTSGLTIGREKFGTLTLEQTDGKQASTYKYTTNYNGPKDLFCLDPNLAGPTHQYIMARPFNIGDGTGNGYDVKMARAYALYIEKSVAINDFEKYYQTANVVMRAITVAQPYSTEGGDFPSKLDVYKNIVTQFKTGSATGTRLKDTVAEYAIARQWFCSATKSSCSGITNTDVQLKNFKIKIEGVPDEIKTDSSGDSFTKTMPVEVSKLSDFTSDDRYNKAIGSFPAPFIEITNVNCNNTNITTCKLTDAAGNDLKVNKINLLTLAGKNDAINIQLVISGKSSDFKTNTDIKVDIEYKYYHILDTSRLAALRYSIGAQLEQRLIMVSSDSASFGNVGVSIKVPSLCKYNPVDGTYSIGVNSLSGAKEYMENGCCDIPDIKVLTDDELKYYQKNCATKDTVALCPKCQEGGDKGCKSEVLQDPLSEIMDNIRNQDDKLDKPALGKSGVNEESQYLKNLDNYNNNRDDVYLLSYLKTKPSENKYCRLYTSEDTAISYPGSITTVSGRYFTFVDEDGNPMQPSIKSTIDVNFHTNVDHWRNDYKKAIEEEKRLYTLWQTAAAEEKAVDNLPAACTSDGGCGYCGDNADGSTGASNCSPPTKWTGTSTTVWSYDNGDKFYDDKGNEIKKSASQECDCGTNSRTSKPTTTAAQRKIDYEAAVSHRKSLENMKLECEEASNIKDNWKYLHAPDMMFYYDQDYQDPISGKIKTEVEPYPLIISKKDEVEATEYHTKAEEIARIEKFWPNWTEDPIVKSGSVEGTKTLKSDYNEVYGAQKAGASCALINNENPCEIKISYDIETDYTIGYEHEVYYRSDISYYSLIPSGLTVPTSSYSFTNNSYIDIGYVFTVNVTTYGGIYNWWLETTNIGHYKANAKDTKSLTTKKPVWPEFDIVQRSNIQYSVDNHWVDNPEDIIQDFTDLNHIINGEKELITHTCFWETDNEIIDPPAECIPADVTNRINPDECPPEESWSPNVFYRTIATGDINPLDRDLGENWSDSNDKGRSAREKIEVLGNEIYNDAADWVEYSFTVSPTDMNDIKKYNETHTYYDPLECNPDGKECTSPFIDWLDSLGTEVVKDISGRSKWKYYIEETSSWENDYRSFFTGGRYPEETAGLTYWP